MLLHRSFSCTAALSILRCKIVPSVECFVLVFVSCFVYFRYSKLKIGSVKLFGTLYDVILTPFTFY
ncbi:hypothetical protein WUBG_07259 [Wuchereria bancrofti]|uniref:Uncharacterized protein n=1 Tax=Wuchereria bancrofti TaxID=6293 RepID=J9F3C7_WUCBA|nr:hypothetical protein WUBG_07259 [Wuchereria bancrofti]